MQGTFLKQDTPSGRMKHAGPFSEEAAAAECEDEKAEVPISSGTPAHVARPRVPQNTPAEGLIPLKEAILRSEGTDSDSSNEGGMPSEARQETAESLISSHSSAAIEGIRSKLVALAQEAEGQVKPEAFMSLKP